MAEVLKEPHLDHYDANLGSTRGSYHATTQLGLLLQGQFAEGLASCINSRMGPLEQQQQVRESMARNIADAAEAAAAQSQVPRPRA